MPIYTYKCLECETITEEIVPTAERDSIVFQCEKCKGSQAERLIEGTNFSLKGSGWAKDGYSKKPLPAPEED